VKKPKAMLLTPGAGADRNQSALVALDDALSELGIVVERMDFPYRLAGRRAPDRAPVLIEAVRSGATQLAARANATSRTVALGGRSMGGRICSMAVADGLRAAALVLISYPLHPPGKPDRLRVDHFGAIAVPCLFVSGTKDPFGAPEELERHTKELRGPVTHVWVEGGGHDFKRHDDEVAGTISDWLHGLGRRRAR
jgi:predicted alpha/beta-hydrolase family hydrolase